MIQRAKTAKDKGFGHSIDFAWLEWSDIAYYDSDNNTLLLIVIGLPRRVMNYA